MNGDSSPPMLSTEQIQKCLEENQVLIMAILEGQSQGKHREIAPYQTRLQNNLTFLAGLADLNTQPEPQAQMHSQGQGVQRQPQVAMSQQRPDFSTVNSAFDMNEQQQQHHLAMSSQQPDLSTSKLDLQMNVQQHYKQPTFFQQPDLSTSKLDLQMNVQQHYKQPTFFQQPDLSTSKLDLQMNVQQHYKQPTFFQQRQLFPEGMNNFSSGTNNTNNSGMQTRICNVPDTPSFNQMGSDVGPGWS